MLYPSDSTSLTNMSESTLTDSDSIFHLERLRYEPRHPCIYRMAEAFRLAPNPKQASEPKEVLLHPNNLSDTTSTFQAQQSLLQSLCLSSVASLWIIQRIGTMRNTLPALRRCVYRCPIGCLSTDVFIRKGAQLVEQTQVPRSRLRDVAVVLGCVTGQISVVSCSARSCLTSSVSY